MIRGYQVLREEVDGIWGLVIYRPQEATQHGMLVLSADEARTVLRDAMLNQDARERLAVLGRWLAASEMAVFSMHRTIGCPDVLQAFLHTETKRTDCGGVAMARVFACSITPVQRIFEDLLHEPWIIEGLDHQFALVTSYDGLIVALEVWCQRVFPKLALPRIMIAPPIPA